MFTLAWRGVRHNAGRYVATLIAIITGVAFFAATGFVADRVIDALEGDVDREFGNVDVAVVAQDDADVSGSAFAADVRIGEEAAAQLLAAPGVEAGAGVLTGSVSFLAADGGTFADGATGRLWIEDDDLNPIEVVDGSPPVGAGEIAVDRGTADDEDLAVGDTVTVLTLAGQHEATIVGITAFGGNDGLDQGGTVSLSAADAFEWLNSGLVEFEELYLRGPEGGAVLRDAVAPLTPSGFEAQTGEEFRQDKREEVGGFGRILKQGLQFFALLALFVGGFVIYNTFSVIVAQRLRELAVLAAIGATPKQLKRSMRFEGLVIGVLGSALGVVVGVGLAFALMALLGVLGIDLPGSGLRVGPSVVVQGIVVGTLITYVSVTVPARRAARTEPIEALRQASAEPTRISRRRTTLALGLVVGGVAAMLFGGAALVGVGALALFIGTILSGPLVAVFGAKVARPVLERLGLEGRLAADNTARNPQRTATTANALLIGVFLVTLVTVAGTSIKDFVVGEINELSSADYVIRSDGGTIDDQLVSDLTAVEGVSAVVPFRQESVTVDGAPAALATGDIAALVEIADVDVALGTLDDLGPGTVALIEDPVQEQILGSTVELVDAAGDRIDLVVVALLESSIDTLEMGNLTEPGTFDSFVGDTAPTMAFLDVVSGAQSDTEDGIEAITDLRPDITLTAGNSIGRMFGNIFDFLINAVDGLLLMSVVVALIGIVNTLSLSILERRRELGLLRVVGMVDRRVQRMVRIESVLISFLGTASGIVLGTFVGFALIHAIDRLSDADLPFRLPWLYLLVVAGLGVLLGLLASLIPARRSTRLDVLDAVQAG